MSNTEDRYRVVVDGIGARTGTVATEPSSRDAAMRGFDRAVDTFARDVAAGDMRVSVLAETEYQRRPAHKRPEWPDTDR